VLSLCQGDVLPAAEICGDGHDQDCNGADAACAPCNPDGACVDADPCTSDSCANGQCRHELPAGFALFDCRATTLGQALGSIVNGCPASGHPAARVREARRLTAMLGRIEKLAGRANAAHSRKLCVRRVRGARRLAMRLQHHLDTMAARGIVCDPAAVVIRPELTAVHQAIVAVSSCAGKP
jgi:hypothetical protein